MKTLCFFLFTVMAAFGADPGTTPAAAGPFAPLMDLLGGNAGRVVQIITLVGSLRVVFKLFSGKIQLFFEHALARVVETSDTEDDHLAEVILRHPLYRLFAFFVDMITSLKLPLVLPTNSKGEVASNGSRLTAWLLPFLLASAIALPLAGCSSTQQRNVYTASGISHSTVTAALGAWNDYLGTAYAQAGTNVSARVQLLSEEKAVKDAFEKYRTAQLFVIDASAAFAQDANTTNGPPAQDRLQQALNASAATAADILALLTQFGVKIH